MLFRWLPVLAGVLVLAAGPIRLYLKDGTHHLVREYKVMADRVRYYSTERSDWEEIPLELADLKKTEAEQKAQAEAEKKEAADTAAEEAFELEQRREVALIPPGPGLFLVSAGQARVFKQAEVKVVSNKRRSILKAITPVPLVAGKSTLEVDGEESTNLVEEARPTFYYRLTEEQRFALVKCTRKKGARIVETWNFVPVTKELLAERAEIEVFQQEVGPGLFRVWPLKPLPAGDYALIEFTEGKGNTQVWDFRIPPAGGR